MRDSNSHPQLGRLTCYPLNTNGTCAFLKNATSVSISYKGHFGRSRTCSTGLSSDVLRSRLGDLDHDPIVIGHRYTTKWKRGSVFACEPTSHVITVLPSGFCRAFGADASDWLPIIGRCGHDLRSRPRDAIPSWLIPRNPVADSKRLGFSAMLPECLLPPT